MEQNTIPKKNRPSTTTDYTEFTHIDTPIDVRRKLDVGDIYMNAGQCPECKYVIRSRNRHDLVYCKCGKCFIDGGSWYTRTSGPIELHTVLYMHRED